MMSSESKISSALSTIARVRDESSSAIVFISFGKDSLVLLDLVYPHFERIVCVFMYFVKDLEHINRYLRYCRKKYPKAEWVQTPHWNLSFIHKYGMYCEPSPNTRQLKLADKVTEVREATGIHWTFIGMKKADSLNRRLMMMQYEEKAYTSNGYAYPLAEWTNRDVLAYMKTAKLPAPIIYAPRNGKASSGIGFNEECFLWMLENCPEDLKKIYQDYPLSERILFEYDRRNRKDYQQE